MAAAEGIKGPWHWRVEDAGLTIWPGDAFCALTVPSLPPKMGTAAGGRGARTEAHEAWECAPA